MHEIDPILFRWGLHQLIDPSLDSNYPCIQNQLDAEVGGMQHANGSNIREDCTSVENDEVIAHALQEELSQVALAEASRHSYGADEEQLHASVLAQNWINKEDLGGEPPKRVLDDKDSSMSCSIPDDNLPNNEMRSLQLTDDFSTLDGEVYKRFNQMTSIPHVPKINGVIPTDDEATSDHQRLLDRLKVYDLVEFKIQGDGNCQFRALSDQFYRSPEHHMVVRQQIVKQLKSHPTMYEGYVPMAFDDYIKKMSKSGEWGDHVTLQAAADSYGVKIFILTSFKDTCYIEILPAVQKSERVICLSFWAEVHYNSIYPEEELPISEAKKKRRWWHIRL